MWHLELPEMKAEVVVIVALFSGTKTRKGILAKGVSAESSVTPKRTKNTQRHWAHVALIDLALKGEIAGSFSLISVHFLGEGCSFTYGWSFLLTVELLCLQSAQVLMKRTFPL